MTGRSEYILEVISENFEVQNAGGSPHAFRNDGIIPFLRKAFADIIHKYMQDKVIHLRVLEGCSDDGRKDCSRNRPVRLSVLSE
jgi:hypothetical protein